MPEIKAAIHLNVGGTDPNAITDIQTPDANTIRVYRGTDFFDLTVGSTNQQINSALVNLDQTII